MKISPAPWRRELWYYVHYFLRRFSAMIFMLPFLVYNYGEDSFLLYFSIFLIALMYDVFVTPHAYDVRIKPQDFVQCVVEKKQIPFVGSMATRKEYFWALIYLYIGLLLLILVVTIDGTSESVAMTFVTVWSVTCSMFAMAYFSFFGPLSLSSQREGRLVTWDNLGSPMGSYWGKRPFFYSFFLHISEIIALATAVFIYSLSFGLFVHYSEVSNSPYWVKILAAIFGPAVCSVFLLMYNNKFSWFKFITINNEIYRKS